MIIIYSVWPIFTNPPDWRKALSNGVKTHLFKIKTTKISRCGLKLWGKNDSSERGGNDWYAQYIPLTWWSRLSHGPSHIAMSSCLLEIIFLFRSKEDVVGGDEEAIIPGPSFPTVQILKRVGWNKILSRREMVATAKFDRVRQTVLTSVCYPNHFLWMTKPNFCVFPLKLRSSFHF